MIRRVAKDQHAQDSPREGDGADVALRRRALVLGRVDHLQHGADGADDAVQVAVREQAGAAGYDRPQALPEALFRLDVAGAARFEAAVGRGVAAGDMVVDGGVLWFFAEDGHRAGLMAL